MACVPGAWRPQGLGLSLGFSRHNDFVFPGSEGVGGRLCPKHLCKQNFDRQSRLNPSSTTLQSPHSSPSPGDSDSLCH